MKTACLHKNNTAPAFTLVEVLVVIAIIAVLAAMTIAGLGVIQKGVDEKRTTVLIQGVENALETYQLENNEIPDGDGSKQSSIALYKALYADYNLDGISDENEIIYFDKLDPNAKGNKLNVSKDEGYIIIDSWQQPIYYSSPGEMNPDFDIWSLGPDEDGGPNASSETRNDDIDNY